MNLVVMMLLDYIADPQISPVDYMIATYILKHDTEIADMTISVFADLLHVSCSQISRFVRHIGFSSFSDFKESLLYHGNPKRHSLVQRGMDCSDFQQHIHEDIDYFYDHFDYTQCVAFVDMLLSVEDIALFGLLNSENNVRELQYNLALHHQICLTFFHIQDQLEYIRHSHGVIVIYSMSGEYVFDNGYSRYYGIVESLKKSQAKIWVVTGNPKVQSLDYVDRVILIPHIHGNLSYLIHCFNDLILSCYLKTRKSFP